MIEGIIWYLFALDCLTYIILTITASMHKKETHHFFKGIPLHWTMAILYVVLVAWLGTALFRLGLIF